MKIPKIIHQTWKDDNIPEWIVPFCQSWKEMNPDWSYKLWTDEMNNNFISKQHPEFVHTYNSYAFNIERVDAVRYFILKDFGGVFVDLDFECLKNIEPLLESKCCLFGREPETHGVVHQRDLIVCNAFMACCPGNDFITTICRHLKKGYFPVANMLSENVPKPAWLKVLETAGPFMLTDLYLNYEKQHEVEIISSEFLYPLTMAETNGIRSSIMDKKELAMNLGSAYAVHYFMGSYAAEL